MEGEALLNKLWVIESLPTGDLKTGTNLVQNQLGQALQGIQGFSVGFGQPKTKVELIDVLKTVRDEARHEGTYPMLHFECHGCQDGLGVASGELVEWDELRESLIEINHACRLNLVVVMAACNGAHLIKVSTKMYRAPFLAVIGPENEVSAGEVENDFGAFYKKFLESMDGHESMKELNRGSNREMRTYHFLSAVGLFAKAYARYYKSHCIGKGRRQRIEYLTTQAMKNPNAQRKGVTWVRNKVKECVAAEDEHFEKLKNQFFFIDCFPDNARRFSFSRDDIINGFFP